MEIRAIEITGSRIGDAPILPDLLDQIADGQRIGCTQFNLKNSQVTRLRLIGNFLRWTP